jgi:hypothetical protein
MPIRMPQTNDWPPYVRLYIYDEDFLLIEESRDRKYDLNDNLFQTWPTASRTVYLGVETSSKNWPAWDEDAVLWIESRVAWDLAFDGNKVKVSRYTRKLGEPCHKEFIWKVEMHDG